eukprot:scpid10762/ scgid2510/ N-acetylglucosamine-1-phosphotransferase subunits alpha/beta; GlcNAc-1-phosphotransferase subunits alpha/beta; Stealth protein GNPTAB; UDP-N-acetylglucosamine-1-phosphotransferase subunits alpha/beta; N-acetylglucosamine-1-phosphotransferase subunit alpha; N-acetylglucosamine-1-phosphotransferase subunit beta
MALLGSTTLKLIQRQLYTCLSKPYGIVLLLGGVLFAFIAILHLGEVALQWSMDQYAAQFSLYHDNIVGDTFQDKLCSPLPIDVVYTWVNGSDPALIADLEAYKYQLEVELNVTRAREELKRQQQLEEEERKSRNCTVTGKNVTVCRNTGNRTRTRLKDAAGEVICPFSDCLPFVTIVVQLHMPDNTTVEQFQRIGFSSAKRVFKTRAGGWHGEEAMALVYASKESLKADLFTLKKSNVTWGNKSLGFTECYVSTLSTLKRASSLEDHLVMKGLAENVALSDVISFANRTFNGTVLEAHLWSANNSAVLRFWNRTFASKAYSTPKSELTLQEKQVELSYGYLVWDELKDPNAATGLPETDDISSASRFQDNEELRFSLRALEKNAPWIRNIYIVTNGQIPRWLNLNHPRIKVVAHKDIFINQSHLPTFSSPAIESHLFRIDGLSDRFLYLNDDVMFGQKVWPDDFYTHSRGHKVYMAWSVPQCNKGCPNSWLRDKYCDSACNTSLCDWDGGDCLGLKPGQKRHYSSFSSTWANKDKSKYCHGSCADTWIGDRYCDTACNVLECGFDGGDCEVGNYHRLWSHPLNTAVGNVTVPTGNHAIYFNLSETFTKVSSGDFSDSSVVRAAIVSQKFKVLTMVFNRNHSLSTVSLFLSGELGNTTNVEVRFNLLVDTKHLGEDQGNVTVANATSNATISATVPPTLPANLTAPTDQSILFWMQGIPSHWSTTPSVRDYPTTMPNITNISVLPEDVQAKVTILKRQLHDEEITPKGYHKFYDALVSPHKTVVLAEYRRQVAAALAMPPTTVPTAQPSSTYGPGNGGDREESPVPVPGHDADVHADTGDDIPAHKQSLDSQHTTTDNGDNAAAADDGVDQANIQPTQAATALPPAQQSSSSSQHKHQQQPQQQQHTGKAAKAGSSSDSSHAAHTSDSTKVSADKLSDSTQQHLSSHKVHKRSEGQDDNEAAAPVAKSAAKTKSPHTTSHSAATTVLPMRITSAKSLEADEKEQASRKTMAKAQEDWEKSATTQAATEFVGTGSLPWEQRNTFTQMLTELHNRRKTEEQYHTQAAPGRRHLMDTFADSLRHVNRLFNRFFGFKSRKVPAHMPHFIDKRIFARLHAMFAEEFAETSSHRLRSPEDMQFSFSYFYYMMSERKPFNVTEVFEQFDVDNSGHLSHRELRTVALRLYTPLDSENMKDFEDVLFECHRYPNRSLEEANATLHNATLHNTTLHNTTLHNTTATLCTNCTNSTSHSVGTSIAPVLSSVPNTTRQVPSSSASMAASTVSTVSATPAGASLLSASPPGSAASTATASAAASATSSPSNTSTAAPSFASSAPSVDHIHENLPLPGNASLNDTQGLPTVTLPFFAQCHKLIKLLNETLFNESMHRHELFGEDDVSFEMLPDNITKVADQLDGVRRKTRKFVCLNDNIDHRKEEALVIKAMIREFYEAMFPKPSQFELPSTIQNRFLHVDELRAWQAEERRHQFWMRASVVSLFAILFVVFCLPKVRRWFRHLGKLLGFVPQRVRLEMKRV